MKSVGEAMAIGRNFKESLQKALVSLEIGFSGLDRIFPLSKKEIEKELKKNIPNRILLAAEAFRKKIKLKRIHQLCKIDPWFLTQIEELLKLEKEIQKLNINTISREVLLTAKQKGYADRQIAHLLTYRRHQQTEPHHQL